MSCVQILSCVLISAVVLGTSVCLLQYGPEHHLTMYPAWLKVQKQQMVQSGKGRQFLPWITGGTYGEMTSVVRTACRIHLRLEPRRGNYLKF